MYGGRVTLVLSCQAQTSTRTHVGSLNQSINCSSIYKYYSDIIDLSKIECSLCHSPKTTFYLLCLFVFSVLSKILPSQLLLFLFLENLRWPQNHAKHVLLTIFMTDQYLIHL